MDIRNIHKCYLSVACRDNTSHNNRRKFQYGLTLIEVLVALLMFGAITVVFVDALNTSYRNTSVIDEHTTARNLAATFIETIRNEPFLTDYTDATESIPRPTQYDADIVLEYSNDGGETWSDNFTATGLQRIIISISREDKPVMSFCDYKMDL